MSRSLWALGLAAALSALATTAAAQCAEGRVSSDETDGRCCWPGQRWSDERARCEGPPVCPEPRVAEGDSCVAPSPIEDTATDSPDEAAASLGAPSPGRDEPPAPRPARDEPPPADPRGTAGWPSSGRPPGVHVRVPLVRRPDAGLRGAGVAFLVVGELLADVMAGGSLAQSNSCWQLYGGLSLIPPIGHLVGTFALSSCSTRVGGIEFFWSMGILSAVVRVVGLIMTIAGAIGGRDYATVRVRPGDLTLGPGPDGSAALRLAF